MSALHATTTAARIAGLSPRHFRRLAEEAHLEPARFRGLKNFWTPGQIDRVKAHYKGEAPVVIDRAYDFTVLDVCPMPVCCPHPIPGSDAWRCCKCNRPTDVAECSVASTLTY
jgi:hypothetical protein